MLTENDLPHHIDERKWIMKAIESELMLGYFP